MSEISKDLEKSETTHCVGLYLLHSQLNLYLEMGKYLEAAGSTVFYYVRSRAELSAVAKRLGVDPSTSNKVTLADVILEGVTAPVPDTNALVSRARALEAKMGETMNRVALSHRHLGNGYSPGSFSYPRDRRLSETDYWQYLNAVTTQVEFWTNEIATKKLTAIIDGGKEAAAACRATGIAFRWLVFARYKDHRAWAVDEFQSLPRVAEIFETISDAEVSPTEPEQYVGATIKNNAFWQRQTLPSLIGRIAANFTVKLGKALLKGDFHKISWKAFFTYPISTYRASVDILARSTASVESLKDTPYVYFPLQKEPEQALLMAAPNFTDQLAIAIDLSRVLPAGVKLAISEHTFGIGRRPPAFYDQLAALPNVVFFSFEESPMARIANALATVTVSGTAAFESATMGKPAIVYNPLSVPTLLAHVFVANEDGSIEDILRRIVDGEWDQGRARIDGAKFEEALGRASFSLGDYGKRTTEDARATLDPNLVSVAGQALLESLASTQQKT